MNPLEHTESVAFELSNSCSHAWLHKECPLSLEMAEAGLNKEPRTLPIAIVRSALETMGEYGYHRQVAFHQYNEPLQDPRLFFLLMLTKKLCPEAEPYIVTNGYNLTPILTQELLDLGVWKIVVSPTGSEYAQEVLLKRVSVLQQAFGDDRIISSQDHQLDDRLLVYDIPRPHPHQPCYAPLRQVVINRDGQVGLCCYDWKRQYTFGDLYEQKLDDILLSDKVLAIYEQLSRGRREYKLCGQCGRSR